MPFMVHKYNMINEVIVMFFTMYIWNLKRHQPFLVLVLGFSLYDNVFADSSLNNVHPTYLIIKY